MCESRSRLHCGLHNVVVPDFAPLREVDLDPDPVRQFDVWFRHAALAGVSAPEAAALGTASTDGAPSVRMVLIKQYDERGFVFYTNYESRKAQELSANPHAALLFHWELVGRQVRIEGHAERTTAAESAAHVRSRAREPAERARVAPEPHDRESRGARAARGRARCRVRRQ